MATIVRTDGFEFSLPVISLSATGAGCLARDKSEEMLMTGDSVTMTFNVPGAQSECHFVANVRYALKQRGGIRYGLDFNAEESPNYMKCQRKITKYVMDEQRRMLKPT